MCEVVAFSHIPIHWKDHGKFLWSWQRLQDDDGDSDESFLEINVLHLFWPNDIQCGEYKIEITNMKISIKKKLSHFILNQCFIFEIFLSFYEYFRNWEYFSRTLNFTMIVKDMKAMVFFG